MKLSKDLIRFFLIPFILMAGIILTIFLTVYYTTSVRTTDGRIVGTNWPREFTKDFEQYMILKDKQLAVSEEGITLLEKHHLWLQLLDAEGNEILQYRKPADISTKYTPNELIELYQYGSSDYSIFLNIMKTEGCEYSYLIGFPLTISKVTMYVDSARFQSGRTAIMLTVILTALLVIGLTVFYNIFVLNSLKRIREALARVAARSYQPTKRHHFLKEIYEGIDQLNQDITLADQRRVQDEQAKEEWLANITHDLKTPLAPVRGYAELLAESETVTSEAEIRRYGKLILKNTLYTEQLVDDLKLTYQLKSGMLPLKYETVNLVRYTKEIVIDVMNTPAYETYNVNFSADRDEISCEFDTGLMRRAITNILVNALKHNEKDTQIMVKVKQKDGTDSKSGFEMIISDQGSGMSEQELAGLFTRYYRGTGSKEQSEGSGLGMAIARQIVEAHGCVICVDSVLHEGTTVTIESGA